jgi:phosphoglycolate phosphatase
VIDFIVFDLDGTLVDSRQDLAESANALLAACGCPTQSEAAIGRMVGDGAATLVARAFAAGGCPAPVDALARFLAIYEARLLQCTRPYRDIESVLAALESRLPIAVLTNKPLASTRRILEGLELARFFPPDHVFGGDGPHPRKPDPAGLRALCDHAGVAPAATLMVGDSVIDWRTARAAGTRVCLASYGFGFDGFPVDELAPDEVTIESPAALLTLL